MKFQQILYAVWIWYKYMLMFWIVSFKLKILFYYSTYKYPHRVQIVAYFPDQNFITKMSNKLFKYPNVHQAKITQTERYKSNIDYRSLTTSIRKQHKKPDVFRLFFIFFIAFEICFLFQNANEDGLLSRNEKAIFIVFATV